MNGKTNKMTIENLSLFRHNVFACSSRVHVYDNTIEMFSKYILTRWRYFFVFGSKHGEVSHSISETTPSQSCQRHVLDVVLPIEGKYRLQKAKIYLREMKVCVCNRLKGR